MKLVVKLMKLNDFPRQASSNLEDLIAATCSLQYSWDRIHSAHTRKAFRPCKGYQLTLTLRDEEAAAMGVDDGME
jgi:hypothetical protein